MKKKKFLIPISFFITVSIGFTFNFLFQEVNALKKVDTFLSNSIEKISNQVFGSGGVIRTSGGGGLSAVVNDTNVTGSLAGSTLTLGWTGTLSAARGGAPSGLDGQTVYFNGTTGTASSTIYINQVTGKIGFGTTTAPARYTFDNGSVSGCEYNMGNQSGTISVNLALCNQQIMTLNGDNVTINLTSASSTQPGISIALVICQDSTGSRTITTWDSRIKWSGLATSTQTGRAGTCDMFSFRGSVGTTTFQYFHTGTSKEL